MPTSQGAIRLFRFAGIDVFLHWSWFVVALYELQRTHALPLAGVERGGVPGPLRDRHPPRVRPLARLPAGGRPRRPHRALAAGRRRLRRPAAAPRRHALEHRRRASRQRHPRPRPLRPDAHRRLRRPRRVVAGRGGLAGDGRSPSTSVLLVFNLLPVYPLDGGQILRSLLWFVLGRARSLTVASVIGFVGVLGLLASPSGSGRVDRDPRRVRRHELLAGVPALPRAVAAGAACRAAPGSPARRADRRRLSEPSGPAASAGRPSTRSRQAPAARPVGRSSARRAASTAGARARSASG